MPLGSYSERLDSGASLQPVFCLMNLPLSVKWRSTAATAVAAGSSLATWVEEILFQGLL